MKINEVSIQPGDLENPKSLSLLGMKRRAVLLEGEIGLAGKSGKGTTVTVEIPFGKIAGQSL